MLAWLAVVKVRAWVKWQMWRRGGALGGSQTQSNVPTRARIAREPGPLARRAHQHIPTYLTATATAKQRARPRCLGLRESRGVVCSTARGFGEGCQCTSGCAACSYSGHSQSQWRSCGARPLQRATFDSWLYLCSLRWPAWAERRQLVSCVLRDNVCMVDIPVICRWSGQDQMQQR